jgi:hypothetical protein
MNHSSNRPPHLQYTKSNQTTTQPSRQHTMQPLLLHQLWLPLLSSRHRSHSHEPLTTAVITKLMSQAIDSPPYHKHAMIPLQSAGCKFHCILLLILLSILNSLRFIFRLLGAVCIS